MGNCDTTLFLGGKEKSTLKEISELLGKETIDSFNQSENRGSQVSHGLNYQKLGKELMTQDEIAVMDGGKCILQLRGVRPFFSDKFDITKHPRYKYLADADKKNTFDIERYMKRRPAIVKPDEPFDLYEFVNMSFFTNAIDVLQTLVIALGGGLCVWGGINLLEGYGQDNPASKSQGIKQLMAGGGVALIGITLIPLLSGLLSTT